jgi:hypothetical protein
MNKTKKLVGSVTQDDFILGLLLARGVESSGDIWEKVVGCSYCKFAKQCSEICYELEDLGKNPRCGDVVNLLLGEIKVEAIK